MDTFIYRIQTDGAQYICEVQQEGNQEKGKTWRRVCFQDGRVIKTDTLSTASLGEFFDNERELLRTIESVVGTSARRVREWRTV